MRDRSVSSFSKGTLALTHSHAVYSQKSKLSYVRVISRSRARPVYLLRCTGPSARFYIRVRDKASNFRNERCKRKPVGRRERGTARDRIFFVSFREPAPSLSVLKNPLALRVNEILFYPRLSYTDLYIREKSLNIEEFSRYT